MSVVTELNLFKAGVEQPICIANLLDLNMDMQSDPADAHQIDPELLIKKKAQRLFQMVWSGITKNINSITQKGRGVEFPSLGIFMPIEEALPREP